MAAKIDAKTDTPAAPPATSAKFSTLMRMAGWGFCAAFTLGVAAILSQTESGVERIQHALAGTRDTAPATSAQLVAKTYDPEIETRRLSRQLQALAADRDRLADRVASLERNFDDVTGSVKSVTTARITAPPKPPATAALPPIISAPATASPPAPSPPAPIPPVAAAPPAPANDNKPSTPPTPPIRAAEISPAPAPDDTPTASVPLPPARMSALPDMKPAEKEFAPADNPGGKLDYGIDLGGASTIEGLRGLWNSTRVAHAPLLDNLQPAAILRPTGKNGAPQLRLMAGPFTDASSAAAICKAFALGRGTCRAFAFDGQKLPLR